MGNALGMVVNGLKIPAVAEEALDKFDCVQMGTIATNAQYVKKGTAGVKGIGFVDEEYAAADAVKVIVNGTAKARASGSITAGDWLKAAADGEVATADSDADVIVGRALEAASEADDIIAVEVIKGTLAVATE